MRIYVMSYKGIAHYAFWTIQDANDYLRTQREADPLDFEYYSITCLAIDDLRTALNNANKDTQLIETPPPHEVLNRVQREALRALREAQAN